MKRIKGLTLIKLFPFVAIIGIIMAIAVPSYLGKFEKANIENGQGESKASISNMIAASKKIGAAGPFSLLPPEGQEECIGSSDTAVTEDTCQTIYSQYADITCTSQPNGTSDIICAEFFQDDAGIVSER